MKTIAAASPQSQGNIQELLICWEKHGVLLFLLFINVKWYWTWICTSLCCHSSGSSPCQRQNEVHGAPLWHPNCCSPASPLKAWAVKHSDVKSRRGKKGRIPWRGRYLLVEMWAAGSDWLGDVEVRVEWSWGSMEAMLGHLQLRWTAAGALRRLVFVETSSQSCDP